MTGTDYICWFHEEGGTELARVGGKGANLGHMAVAGFPVPPGFSVAAEAYRDFVLGTGLQERVLAVIDGVTDQAEVSVKSATVRQLILAEPMPDEIARQVREAYSQLGDGDARVAVRSSATAEDLPEASFAGQQDTYLNVLGIDALLEHVRRCWASLWTARATSYRIEHGFDHAQVLLSVVVQEMIESDVAGVMFTANPVNGRFDETVINASYGLGEAVVSGIVTPDTFVVRPRSGRVRHREIAHKAIEIVYAEGGVQERPVAPERAEAASLDDAAVVALAGLGQRISDYYGTPQDIEWAYRDGEVYLLQSRPITTLGRRPTVDPRDHWTREMFLEVLPDAPSPVFGSVLERIFTEMLEFTFRELGQRHDPSIPGVGVFYSHPYFNLRYIRAALGGLPDHTREQLTARIANPFTAAETGAKADRGRPSLAEIRLAWKMFLAARNVPRRLPDVVETYYAELKPYRTLDAKDMSQHELTRGLVHLAYEVLPPLVAWDFLLIAALGFAERIQGSEVERSGVDDPEHVKGVLISGLTGNLTMKTNKEMWDLARAARDEPAVLAALTAPPDGGIADRVRAAAGDGAFAQRLEKFLADYGNREARMDIVYPTWGEDPSPVLRFVRAYLSAEGAPDPADQESDAARARANAVTAVEAGLGRSVGGLVHRRLFRWAAGAAQALGADRDTMHFHWTTAFPIMRRLLREFGERGVAAGVLDAWEDVWCLTIDDLPDLADNPRPYQDVVALRRQNWERDLRTPSPLQIVRGEEVYPETPSPYDLGSEGLRGIAGSPGRVTGVVRVVSGPEDFGKLGKGEILVAPWTNPVWTPLFAIAGGLVTDTGGILSHGAIVAREYGIPAVMGAAGASHNLHDGQVVTVDGTNGVVSVVEK